LSRSLIGYNGLDNCKAIPYNANVIRSFRSKGSRRFAERGDASRLSVQNPDRVRRIVLALNAAKSPEGMNIPGFRFHALRERIAADTRSMRVAIGE